MLPATSTLQPSSCTLNRGRCCSGREFSENQQEQLQLSACVYTGGDHLENGGTAKDPGGIFHLLVLKRSKWGSEISSELPKGEMVAQPD